MAIGQRRAQGKQFVIPVAIHIPVAALTALRSGDEYAGAFSVYLAWAGRVGGVSDPSHKTKSYRIPAAEMEKARGGHLTYELELSADSYTQRVALGVLDEVSKDYALRLIELGQ